MRELEVENARLKKLLAEAKLDEAMLKELAEETRAASHLMLHTTWHREVTSQSSGRGSAPAIDRPLRCVDRNR